MYTDRKELRTLITITHNQSTLTKEELEGNTAIDELTGLKFTNRWAGMDKRNYYGYHLITDRNNSYYNDFIWLVDLKTYVLLDEPALAESLVRLETGWSGAKGYLRCNETELVATEVIVYATDVDAYVLRDQATWVENLDEWNRWQDGLCFIQDLEEWVTDQYAEDNYHYDYDNCEWYSYPRSSSSDSGDNLLSYCAKADREFGFITENGATAIPLPKTLYFGIELEYEFEDEDCSQEGDVVQLSNGCSFLACSDGSLDCGFELKSAPCTFNVLKEKLKGVREALKPISYQAQRTCGVHIHVSRNALTDLQIGRMQDFVYKGSNQRLITAIAGRGAGQYCYRNEDSLTITSRYMRDHDYPRKPDGSYRKKHHGGDNGRYECLNLTGTHTVEFRLFKGAKDLDVIYRYLEFSKAIIEFTSDAHRTTNTQEAFITYVRKYRKQFPNLWNKISEFMKGQGKENVVNLYAERNKKRKGVAA